MQLGIVVVFAALMYGIVKVDLVVYDFCDMHVLVKSERG